MDDWLEYLKVTEFLLGFMGFVLTSLVGWFYWWDKRSRRYVDLKATTFTNSNTKVADRLKVVEADLKRLDKDVGSLQDRVDGLPTAKDFSSLQVSIAMIDATLMQLNGMTQTLYKAAMRASPGGSE